MILQTEPTTWTKVCSFALWMVILEYAISFLNGTKFHVKNSRIGSGIFFLLLTEFYPYHLGLYSSHPGSVIANICT